MWIDGVHVLMWIGGVRVVRCGSMECVFPYVDRWMDGWLARCGRMVVRRGRMAFVADGWMDAVCVKMQ